MDLRAAFVTPLIASLFVACGGSVGDPAAPGGDGGSDTAVSDTSPSGDTAPGSDSSPPLDGSPGDSGPTPGCPAAPPSMGTPCAPNGLVCGFGEDPRPSCRQQATCTDGRWDTPAGVCPPLPIETCPGSAAEANGKTCTTTGAYCTYGDVVCGCGACFGGPCGTTARWTCADPPTSPDCPKKMPNLGVACTKEGASCVYGSCSSGNIAGLDCKGGYWTASPVACPAMD